jgi:MoxR-like ATPase
VDFKDLKQAIEVEVPAIDVPVGTIETVLKLRDELRQAQIVPSDRRWKACVKLLQASAFFNGRSQVEDDDLHVLRYALWDGPEQIVPVERMTLSLSNPVAEKCLTLLDDAEKIAAGIRDRKGQSLEARASYGTEANGKLKVLVSEIAQLKQECLAAGRSTTKIDEVADRVSAVRRSVYVDCLDMDPSMIR